MQFRLLSKRKDQKKEKFRADELVSKWDQITEYDASVITLPLKMQCAEGSCEVPMYVTNNQ